MVFSAHFARLWLTILDKRGEERSKIVQGQNTIDDEKRYELRTRFLMLLFSSPGGSCTYDMKFNIIR